MGWGDEPQFQNYHRVLNHAKWSSYALGWILLRLLVQVFVPADVRIGGHRRNHRVPSMRQD
jgi:hypothetical protein